MANIWSKTKSAFRTLFQTKSPEVETAVESDHTSVKAQIEDHESMRIIESSKPARQLPDTQPPGPTTSIPINNSSSFQPLATTLLTKDVQSCQDDASNDNDNEIEQPSPSELETELQLFKDSYPEFIGNLKEFQMCVAMAYGETKAGKGIQVDKYIGLIPRWRTLLQSYLKGHKRYPGLLLQWISSYPDDWDDEVVTANWMYRVMEETEEGRELKGKMALLKEMMAKKAKTVARQAAKKGKRKNTDQTGL
jgi:hypothetical protein